MEEKIAKRKDSNKEIVKILDYLAEKMPDFRFWQILWYLFLDLEQDRFYEESVDSLEIIKEHLRDLYPNMFEELVNLKLIVNND